jgi:hypothetical protein
VPHPDPEAAAHGTSDAAEGLEGRQYRALAVSAARFASTSASHSMTASREFRRRPSHRTVTSSGVGCRSWRIPSNHSSAVITGCAATSATYLAPVRVPRAAIQAQEAIQNGAVRDLLHTHFATGPDGEQINRPE